MSRLLLTALLCVLIVAPAHAMKYEGAVIKAGAGFMFSDAQYSFDGADRLEGDTQIGATAGVSTLWRMSRKSPWMLVIGLDWIQRGYSGTRDIPGLDPVPTKVDVLADFISVPVFGRVHFLEEDLTIYALFGPSLEFRISHDDDPLLDEGEGLRARRERGHRLRVRGGADEGAAARSCATTSTSPIRGMAAISTRSPRALPGFMVTGGFRF